MSRREELTALADRVEALDGLCRRMDAEILLALGYEVKKPNARVTDVGRIPGVFQYHGEGVIGRVSKFRKRIPPKFTTDINSAMSLVPDGCGWLVGYGRTRPDEPYGGAQIVTNANGKGEQVIIAIAEAATPALALTAAALRALAETEQ